MTPYSSDTCNIFFHEEEVLANIKWQPEVPKLQDLQGSGISDDGRSY